MREVRSRLLLVRNKHTGFTIVELLVVIVIIAILAAITIVAYSGIQGRARAATLQDDVRSASTQLGMDKVVNGTYPTSTSAANSGQGLKASSGTTWQYTYTSNPDGYCLTGTNGGISYFVSSDNLTPQAGACPGDVNGGGGSGQIVDGSVTKPGWGYIYAISSNGVSGNNTEIQLNTNTVNATQDGPGATSLFTNMPFLTTPANINNYSDANGNTFSNSITDAHIVGGSVNVVLKPGASVVGYLTSNSVSYLAFQDSPNSGTYNVAVPTANLPTKWSDWNGTYLMFKVGGVQQALQINIAAWADGTP